MDQLSSASCHMDSRRSVGLGSCAAVCSDLISPGHWLRARARPFASDGMAYFSILLVPAKLRAGPELPGEWLGYST